MDISEVTNSLEFCNLGSPSATVIAFKKATLQGEDITQKRH